MRITTDCRLIQSLTGPGSGVVLIERGPTVTMTPGTPQPEPDLPTETSQCVSPLPGVISGTGTGSTQDTERFSLDGGACRVVVAGQTSVPVPASGKPLVVDLHGPGGRLWHLLSESVTAEHWEFPLVDTIPPGEYAFSMVAPDGPWTVTITHY